MRGALKLFGKSLSLVGIIALYFVFVFVDYWRTLRLRPESLGVFRNDALMLIEQPQAHWGWLLATLLYICCSVLAAQAYANFARRLMPVMLFSFCVITPLFFTELPNALKTAFQNTLPTNCLLLLTGAAISAIIAVLANWHQIRFQSLAKFVLLTIVFGGSIAVSMETTSGFYYRNQTRLTGPWESPNTFGVYLALGLTASAGCVLQDLMFTKHSFDKIDWRRSVFLGFLIGMILILGVGLLWSYSRGAWISCLIGLSVLFFRFIVVGIRINDRFCLLAKRNVFLLVIGFVGLALLLYRNCQATDNDIFRRLASVGNVNDFSQRNRLYTYMGALQMIKENCFGIGWNFSLFYINYYKPPILNDGIAILINDYFSLGMQLGVIGLISFNFCLSPVIEILFKQSLQNRECGWSEITVAACCCVLLIGFWFNGGLFDSALAIPFWLLIGLCIYGCERNKPTT